MANVPKTAKAEVCSFDLNWWKKRSSDALMKEWARRGASSPARTNIQGTIKNWLANYATYKSVRTRAKRTKDKGSYRAARVYKDIAKRLETEIRHAQKSCPTSVMMPHLRRGRRQ